MNARPDTIATTAGTRCDSAAAGPLSGAARPAGPTPAQALGMAAFDRAEARRQLVDYLDSGGYDAAHPYRVLLDGMAPADQETARLQLVDFLDACGFDVRHPYRVLLAELPAPGAPAPAASIGAAGEQLAAARWVFADLAGQARRLQSLLIDSSESERPAEVFSAAAQLAGCIGYLADQASVQPIPGAVKAGGGRWLFSPRACEALGVLRGGA